MAKWPPSSPSASSGDEEEPKWNSKFQLKEKPNSVTENSNSTTSNNKTRRKKDTIDYCPPRREDNMFSLKQFLQTDNQANYQSTGARPKIYETRAKSTEPNNKNHETGKYTRNPTELPDFVQDHLVMEQCYLNDNACPKSEIIEWGNLPDFALSSVEKRLGAPDCINQTQKNYEDDRVSRSSLSSLDQSSNMQSGQNSTNRDSANASSDIPEILGFSLNLQNHQETESNQNNVDVIGIQNSNETSNVKLPDFLTDAPIRNLSSPISNRQNCSNESSNHLVIENERLRSELQLARRQISDYLSRINSLESEISTRRQSTQTENANLEKAIEQVEDDLKRSTRRAISAECTVASLKREIDSLSMEILMLRTENRDLRTGVGAECNSCRNVNSDRRIHRLAEDLRAAASTAEISLRQLMSGVKNLRTLASALENVDKVEEQTKDFLPDFDEDNAAGPAL